MSAAIIERVHMLDAATIERQTRVADGAGGWAETWSIVGVSPCNVQYRVQRGDETLDRRDVLRVAAVVRFPPTVDVRKDDRVIVRGVRYRVEQVHVKTRAWTLVAVCSQWGDE